MLAPIPRPHLVPPTPKKEIPVHLYGSGLWRQFSNYAHPPSGAAQIAVRSTYWSDSQAACNNLVSWTAQQNYAGST